MSSLHLKLKLLLFVIFANILFAANVPYSYSYTPKYVYKNQIFAVTILSKHYDVNQEPTFEFDTLSMYQPLSDKPVKTINKDEAFFTFYFKAKSLQDYIEIPSLVLSSSDFSYVMKPITIEQRDLNATVKNFSGVLAASLKINGIKIDSYDSQHNIVTLSINAVSANLEDMHIPNVVDDGVENLKITGSNIKSKYYFIVPSTKLKSSFSYYNIIKRDFENIGFDINKDKSSMNNKNLAPVDLTFDKLKKYSLIVITIFFILMYVITRDKLYIFLFILTSALLVYIYYSKKTICVQEGANLYILPTNNSNISLQIDRELKTTLVKRYNKFNKIEYKNNMIGWIKDEDLCKN